ncbi:MAG: hypothetical protein P8124_04115 [Gammaproteobacteria bacterium]
MSESQILLSIVELGGYPDFSPLYRRAGFEVERVTSMRKALSALPSLRPAVVVSEFVYSPMYSTRVSNLESLFAGLQRSAPEARLIVFFDQENVQHLDSLRSQFPIFETLPFPVSEDALRQALERAAG